MSAANAARKELRKLRKTRGRDARREKIRSLIIDSGLLHLVAHQWRYGHDVQVHLQAVHGLGREHSEKPQQIGGEPLGRSEKKAGHDATCPPTGLSHFDKLCASWCVDDEGAVL